MTARAKFMIRFAGAVYANELMSDDPGDYVYELDEAIAEAERQFGPTGWELWNGSASESRLPQ